MPSVSLLQSKLQHHNTHGLFISKSGFLWPLESSDDLLLHPSVPPGPPTPWIVDTGKDSVIVAWKPPLYNGGGDILGYHVEKVPDVNI